MFEYKDIISSTWMILEKWGGDEVVQMLMLKMTLKVVQAINTL